MKPILFSTPMVQAVMDGTKTQTRRTRGLDAINQNPDEWELVHLGRLNSQKPELCVRMYHNPTGRPMTIKVPYGYPGSGLWVRETWLETQQCAYWYKASFRESFDHSLSGLKWRPSIFMPKGACRIFLQIESIRLERLNDITRRDAVKEGIKNIHQGNELFTSPCWKNYQFKGGHTELVGWPSPLHSFKSLWESIHGEGSWKDNPWLWVVDFKRIEMPEDWPKTK